MWPPFEWGAPLDLFVAPKRLKTHTLPLFCSDKWFWWDVGWRGKKKSVCVQDSDRDVGVFQQLNYIKRQSPSDMHTHIYSANKYGCSHSCRLMNVNVFTGTFLPLGGIRWNKTAQCWDGERFWLEERVSTHTSNMFFWSPCLLGRKYYKGLACLFWLGRVKVNGQGWIN